MGAVRRPSPKVGKMKIPRLEQPSDFSNQVKDRLSQYTRTGQACDRCKIRKIRCDPNPMGCGHCIQQNMPCVATDRVNGRPVERAYLVKLEAEAATLREYVQNLETILQQNHLHAVPGHLSPNGPPPAPLDVGGNLIMDPSINPWSRVGSTWVVTLPPTANFDPVLFRTVQMAPPAVTQPAQGGNVPPNAPNALNAPNASNALNVPNGLNAPNAQNAYNAYNIPNGYNGHNGLHAHYAHHAHHVHPAHHAHLAHLAHHPRHTHNGHNAHNGARLSLGDVSMAMSPLEDPARDQSNSPIHNNSGSASPIAMMPSVSTPGNPMMYAPQTSQEDLYSRNLTAWPGWNASIDATQSRFNGTTGLVNLAPAQRDLGAQGTLPNGTLHNGTLHNGALPNGALPNGTHHNGTLSNEALPNGSLTNGTLTNGTLTNGTLTNGTLTNGTLPNDSPPDESNHYQSH